MLTQRKTARNGERMCVYIYIYKSGTLICAFDEAAAHFLLEIGKVPQSTATDNNER